MQKLISPADAVQIAGVSTAKPMRPAMVTIAALGSNPTLPPYERIRRFAGKPQPRPATPSLGDSA